MIRFLLLFISCIVVQAIPLKGQEVVDSASLAQVEAWDEGGVDYRQPPVEQIEQWKNSPRYVYDRDAGPGFWNFIFARVLNWLGSFMGERPWSFYVLLVIGGLLVLFLLLRLLDVPVAGLFVMSRHKGESQLRFVDEAHEYPTAKLKEMLAMFRNNKAWREALRMMFLIYLRELEARGEITIKPFKTNQEYYREIQDSQIKETFRKRKRLFDIVWYGHVELNGDQFGQVESLFNAEVGKEVQL